MKLNSIIRNILAGAIAGGAALVGELAIDTFGAFYFSHPVTSATVPVLIIFLFPLLEESFKYLAIRKMPAGADPASSGLSLFIAIGAGFGLLEVALTPIFEIGLSAAGPEALFGPFLIHILTAIAIGWSIQFLQRNRLSTFLAVFPSLLIHSAFNAWVFSLS